jgi:Na+(H+)/acetate symporter ActP
LLSLSLSRRLSLLLSRRLSLSLAVVAAVAVSLAIAVAVSLAIAVADLYCRRCYRNKKKHQKQERVLIDLAHTIILANQKIVSGKNPNIRR